MANTVKIKRSSVASKVPTTSDLELGELALNTYDGKLFTKKDDGTASVVELSGGSGGSTAPVLETPHTISEDYTVTAGHNAASISNVSVDNGVTVTVPNGSVWRVFQ